jgi:hypothetical protein
MNMKDEAGLRLNIHWVQLALISAYEDNCPLRPVKIGRQFLKWTSELESFRRGVRRLCIKCRTDNARSWEFYRGSAEILRSQERLTKRLGGRPVVTSTTYPGQLHYTRLYLWTLRSGWDFWWLLPEGVRNPTGKPRWL